MWRAGRDGRAWQGDRDAGSAVRRERQIARREYEDERSDSEARAWWDPSATLCWRCGPAAQGNHEQLIGVDQRDRRPRRHRRARAPRSPPARTTHEQLAGKIRNRASRSYTGDLFSDEHKVEARGTLTFLLVTGNHSIAAGHGARAVRTCPTVGFSVLAIEVRGPGSSLDVLLEVLGRKATDLLF